jgi:hypothetical protein
MSPSRPLVRPLLAASPPLDLRLIFPSVPLLSQSSFDLSQRFPLQGLHFPQIFADGVSQTSADFFVISENLRALHPRESAGNCI